LNIKRALVALLMSIGVIVGLGAVPAQAALSDCPSGYMCIWTSTNFTGSRFQYSYGTLVDSYHNGIRLTSGISNHGYSFYNKLGTGLEINIYDSVNCAQSPWYRTMDQFQSATTQGSDWGGRVSSIQLTPASPLTC
jgi:hypothetical protein